MNAVKFKTEQFEGPLDLLLQLIAKRKMDLYDIKIYELIDQYLSAINNFSSEDLDPTSEFIEMAARLVYMKSVALLPKREEAEELERELTGKLVEYHLCKQAAARLRSMSDGVVFFVRDPIEIEFSQDYSVVHDPFELLTAAEGMSGRVLNKKREIDSTGDFDPIITAPVVSVTARIIRILRGVRHGSINNIHDFFKECKTKSESVATFLGVLELIRARRITIDDRGGVAATQHHRRDRRNEHQSL